MNVFSKMLCRAVQLGFRVAIPFLPYREPKLLGNIGNIVDVLKSNNINSVLLVTDSGLKSTTPVLTLEGLITENGIKLAVYDKTSANPTTFNVEQARELYVKENCEAIIAFGGGSPMDCAKAVGARIAYPKKSLDKLQGQLKVLRRLPLLIAVPTTAGTGSEVTVTAVITDTEKKHKYTMNNFSMIPRYAVLDASVTYTLPPHLTATTGMDALTHAVEAYIGGSTTKQTRKLALETVKLIFENIETAYTDGENHTARENMLLAAYKAGIAFSKSYVGYVHAVAHSLGGQYNIPHGLANSVLLPIVLKEYGDCVHKKLHTLGIAAGVANDNDSHKNGAEKFINAILSLNSRLGIPETLSGIKEKDIAK